MYLTSLDINKYLYLVMINASINFHLTQKKKTKQTNTTLHTFKFFSLIFFKDLFKFKNVYKILQSVTKLNKTKYVHKKN